MSANDPSGVLAGEFHPGDINEGPLPQRIPGATLGATWTPGDRFQIAARGDRFDGTTGRIRRLWTGGDGREHAHVTHDDGTYTTWPTSRLEKPTDPSDGAVTQPNPAPSDDATPSLVELDRREAAAEAQADDSKHHGIDIRFDRDDERPSIYFRCDAPSDGLCHVVYDCSCESWHSEEMVDGIPQHRDSDDEVHMGRFVAECRLDDWFDNSDEVLIGDVTIPIRPEWVEGYYIFHVGGAS